MAKKPRGTAVEPPPQPGGTSNGRTASRLETVEKELAYLQGEMQGKMENLATKEDIAKTKTWFLGGVLSGILAILYFAAHVIRVVMEFIQRNSAQP